MNIKHIRIHLNALGRKALKKIGAPFKKLGWLLFDPWLQGKVIEDVGVQVHFWHKIEREALANAIKWDSMGNEKNARKCLEQSRVARLRCEQEIKRLPYQTKAKAKSNNPTDKEKDHERTL